MGDLADGRRRRRSIRRAVMLCALSLSVDIATAIYARTATLFRCQDGTTNLSDRLRTVIVYPAIAAVLATVFVRRMVGEVPVRYRNVLNVLPVAIATLTVIASWFLLRQEPYLVCRD